MNYLKNKFFKSGSIVRKSEAKSTSDHVEESSDKQQIPKIFIFLFLFDFSLELINGSLEKQIRIGEYTSKNIDDVEVVLDPIKIWIYGISILACGLALAVDHFQILLYAMYINLVTLFATVTVITFNIAPYTDVSYWANRKTLLICKYVMGLRYLFDPLKTVFVLQHIVLPEFLEFLIIGLTILMLSRNFAFALVIIFGIFVDDYFVLFAIDIIFLLIIIVLSSCLFFFNRYFVFRKPRSLIDVLKSYLNELKKMKKERKEGDKQKIQYSQILREKSSFQQEIILLDSSLSVVKILFCFLFYYSMLQVIYDAFNFQVQVPTEYENLSKMDAEEIIALMNILNIPLLFVVFQLYRTGALKKLCVPFICVTLSLALLIYAQYMVNMDNVILPEARSSKIRFYNVMDADVNVSSSWTGNVVFPPKSTHAFFVRGWGKSHTMMTVSSKIGFEMRTERALNVDNFKKSYSKTIFAEEFKAIAYVISDLGLIKISGYDDIDSSLELESAGNAHLFIMSAISWNKEDANLILIGKNKVFYESKVPFADKKYSLGVKGGTYDFIVGDKNTTWEVKSYETYSLVFFDILNQTSFYGFQTPNPKLRTCNSSFVHFLSLYAVSLGVSAESVWLTRFLYAETPASSRCLMFAISAFVDSTGKAIYWAFLFLFQNIKFLYVLEAGLLIVIVSFVFFLILATSFKERVTWSDDPSYETEDRKK